LVAQVVKPVHTVGAEGEGQSPGHLHRQFFCDASFQLKFILVKEISPYFLFFLGDPACSTEPESQDTLHVLYLKR